MQRTMIRTVEAVIDKNGKVRLLEAVQLPTARKALVTILEDEFAEISSETALLSEEALVIWIFSGTAWTRFRPCNISAIWRFILPACPGMCSKAAVIFCPKHLPQSLQRRFTMAHPWFE